MTDKRATGVCKAMGVRETSLTECSVDPVVASSIERVATSGLCKRGPNEETCYAKAVLNELFGRACASSRAFDKTLLRWGLVKHDPPKGAQPTHRTLEDALKTIFAATSPAVIAFGENHPTFQTNQVKSALEHFADEAMPWLANAGYKIIVTECLIVGTPEKEFEYYKKTGKIDQQKTPYLHKAYTGIRDPRGLRTLLDTASKLGIRLIGGGLTMKEADSDKDPVELMQRIRDNLLQAVSGAQRLSAKVVVHSGALHNDIQPTHSFSFLNEDGLKKLKLDRSQVAEVDMIIPDFADSPIDKILANLAPSQGITYRKINSTHTVVYARDERSTIAKVACQNVVFKINTTPDYQWAGFGWFVQHGSPLTLADAKKLSKGALVTFSCALGNSNDQELFRKEGLCEKEFRLLDVKTQDR